MDLNDTETAANSSTEARSVVNCQHLPDFEIMLELSDAIVIWTVVAITSTASPTAIFLKALVILAVKQRKALQRLSNIMLSSMAVADLIVGAVCMPLCVVVNIFIVRQVLPQPVCMLDSVAMKLTHITCWCSIFHLTVIAWERYVAIQKWMDYKIIVTRSRLKELAIVAWVLAALSMLLEDILWAVLDQEDQVLAVEGWYVLTSVLTVCFLAVIIYFYAMVYLGVRKRNLSEISQVSALVTVKLENKVAKTMGLVTAALIVSFVPLTVIGMLGAIFPVLWSLSVISLSVLLLNLNSIMSPLIYCYRDRRFRSAVLELLGIRKPQANQPTTVAAPRFVRRKDPFTSLEGVVELQNIETPARLTRSASCDLALVLDSAHLTTLNRSLSAPSLAKGNSSCEGQTQMQQPSTMVVTTVMIHVESREQKEASKSNSKSPNGAKNENGRRNDPFGPSKDVETQKNEMETLKNNLTRSASCNPTVSHLNFQKARLKRSLSAPSLAKGNSSCERQTKMQQPSALMVTTAMFLAEGRKQKEDLKGRRKDRCIEMNESPVKSHKAKLKRPMSLPSLVKFKAVAPANFISI